MFYIQYRDAYCEVLYLINNMQEKNKAKISKKFIDFLKEKQNGNYKVGNISLENPETLKKETKIILSIMYRNYFCSEKEKIELSQKDKEILEKMYSYDNIFNKNMEKDEKKQDIIPIENSLTKVNIFRRLINGFVNILKRKWKK